ncbi:hypothetical protein BHE74_00050952 [Ensete ventricosum]|nr:hypothetical protein GW17_00028124 [Ensete ventricosum]RWW43400.1 hypothetical protein BHE74_00050952 [Ensete ventricosum]
MVDLPSISRGQWTSFATAKGASTAQDRLQPRRSKGGRRVRKGSGADHGRGVLRDLDKTGRRREKTHGRVGGEIGWSGIERRRRWSRRDPEKKRRRGAKGRSTPLR